MNTQTLLEDARKHGGNPLVKRAIVSQAYKSQEFYKGDKITDGEVHILVESWTPQSPGIHKAPYMKYKGQRLRKNGTPTTKEQTAELYAIRSGSIMPLEPTVLHIDTPAGQERMWLRRVRQECEETNEWYVNHMITFQQTNDPRIAMLASTQLWMYNKFWFHMRDSTSINVTIQKMRETHLELLNEGMEKPMECYKRDRLRLLSEKMRAFLIS